MEYSERWLASDEEQCIVAIVGYWVSVAQERLQVQIVELVLLEERVAGQVAQSERVAGQVAQSERVVELVLLEQVVELAVWPCVPSVVEAVHR